MLMNNTVMVCLIDTHIQVTYVHWSIKHCMCILCIYVYIYVCMHVHTLCMLCMCVFMCACMYVHVRMHVCMYKYLLYVQECNQCIYMYILICKLDITVYMDIKDAETVHGFNFVPAISNSLHICDFLVVVTIALDYEEKTEYVFTIVANDTLGQSAAAMVTVEVLSVNEYAPEFKYTGL